MPAARLALAALVAGCLVAGLTGGLLRLGAPLPWSGATWAAHAAVAHGALMIPAFFATVIGIERAVAVKRPWAFAAPAASGLAGLALAAGWHVAGAWIALAASVVLAALHALVLRRQDEPHTRLLLGAALSLLGSNAAWLAAAPAAGVLAGWFAFLVLTIAAERLEMTRLMRRRPGAQAALWAITALLVGSALAALAAMQGAGAGYGAALLLLALWLALFDIARRTVRAAGLSRYMAVCLLGGYAWLAVAGVAWMLHALGVAASRDLALHALGLGFVFSMVLGHAPVILPAVARIKVAWHPVFYAPLALLHLSLVWRFAVAEGGGRALAGTMNAVALVLFAATLVFARRRWLRDHP
jgi:hypothetical protein